MRYNPGDPVWARNVGFNEMPRGEHVAVIIGSEKRLSHMTPCGDVYAVDVQGQPPPPSGPWVFCVCCLRPRRDDYQQHEPIGARKDLGIDFQKECEDEMELVS